MKEYSIWWHNLIDGCSALENQLNQAKWCVGALEGLIVLAMEGAIEIENCDSSPSLISWNVLDEKAYEKAQEEYGLPDGIVWDDEE